MPSIVSIELRVLVAGQYQTSLTYFNGKISGTARDQIIVPTILDFHAVVSDIVEWINKVLSSFPDSPHTMDLPFKEEWEINSSDIIAKLNTGNAILHLVFNKASGIVTLMPRPAFDISVSSFVYSLMVSFRLIKYALGHDLVYPQRLPIGVDL